MSQWHCGMTHCRGGTAIHLAGDAGAKLESVFGSEVAASMIYEASTGTPAPNFFFPTPGGSYGSAVNCIIGSNCGTLPFTVSSSCGEFATQSACNAGTTAPALSPTTKTNVCPTTTIDLTTLTASNTPSASGVSLTWHTGTPATTANKITGTAVAAGTYYAAFFDAPNNCYSNGGVATTSVTATNTPCCSFGSIAPILKQ